MLFTAATLGCAPPPPLPVVATRRSDAASDQLSTWLRLELGLGVGLGPWPGLGLGSGLGSGSGFQLG